VSLERGALGFFSTIEELLERKNSGSGLGNRDYCRCGSANGYRGAFFTEVKWQGREADCSPPTSAKVKKTRLCTSLPHTYSWREALLSTKANVNFYGNFTLVQKTENTAVGIRRTDHTAPSIRYS
jgi:hypothetical protein